MKLSVKVESIEYKLSIDNVYTVKLRYQLKRTLESVNFWPGTLKQLFAKLIYM